MSRDKFCSLLFVAVLIVVAATYAGAQANRATITGTVTDTTGAVVAGADVTATNLETKIPAKTDVEPGRYLRHS